MKITCVGSGVFSIAIASLLSKAKNHQIVIWTPDDTFLEKALKENKLCFDGKNLEKPKNITVTTSMEEAIKDTKAIFLLVASPYVKETILKFKKYYKPFMPIYVGSKGLLDGKPYFYSKYIKITLNTRKTAFFAGPNLASDLILGSEVFITVATKEKSVFDLFVSMVPKRIHLERMKEEKVLELASVLKNIYAIGAGMAYAKSPFSSTIFSYLTECYKEYLQILYLVLDYPNENVYAVKCFVSEEQYRHWLAHYQQPSCEATLPSGERCAIPIDRIDTPSRFTLGDSNCCSRHKASGRLRTVS